MEKDQKRLKEKVCRLEGVRDGGREGRGGEEQRGEFAQISLNLDTMGSHGR